MSPAEHGEVFVLDDGGEVDLDLGNYERYLNIHLTRQNNITTGKMYQHVIERERRGNYLGKTVQIVPDLVDAIADWILGGTAGDMENAPFLESLRRLRGGVERDSFLHILVTLVPIINGEQKTKPTQAAVRNVQSTGLRPALIACRSPLQLETATIAKVAMSCDVKPREVITVRDVASTYYVPTLLKEQGLLPSLSKLLRLDLLTKTPLQVTNGANMWKAWKTITASNDDEWETATIALVGKYTNSVDAYISVVKVLQHSAMACRRKLKFDLLNSTHLEEETRISSIVDYDRAWAMVRKADSIHIPVGFGSRGTESMIAAAKWAIENKVPYLGVCLGMQIAVIEFARHMHDMPKANSIELSEQSPDPVVIFMPEIDKSTMGGTVRLGSRPTFFQPGSESSKLRRLYDKEVIHERHRHRYEVNPDYIERLSDRDLHFIGKDDKGIRMKIVESKDHPCYVGVQFHPEYLSKVLKPSIPFLGFVAAAAGCLEQISRQVSKSDDLPVLVNGDSNGTNI